MLTRICYVLLLSFVLPTCILAEDQWVEVGSAKARVSENTLTIFPATEAAFSKLRFHISHGDVILHQARVYLAKGEVFHINLQKSIKSSKNGDDGQSYSRTVPLITSQQSSIKKVTVFYKFKQQHTPSKQVKIELMGVPIP
ncbi:hypothetical protein [Endozoicomonas elysicola]|uniref:DUF4426 domain-containing protein n=1 Tax=Endozoicomonas elysicola TaxID=305900 RepID=A0A081K736_9GAMM|nr:hypothetical protein [Endozoicomonas elysicola]KEI69962.1 hypothetical protein GV64_03670 [Endozoicomonas elysicola]